MVNKKLMQEKLDKIKAMHNRLDKCLYFTAVLTSGLEEYGIKPILVGGGALEFYTQGSYMTLDVDLVIQGRDQAKRVLDEMGFKRGIGEKSWYSEELDLSVEIPDDTINGSLDRVTVVEMDDDLVAYVIGIEDLIIDRLNAYKWWKSLSDGQWALACLTIHIDSIDYEYLRGRAKEENILDVLEETVDKAKKILSKSPGSA